MGVSLANRLIELNQHRTPAAHLDISIINGGPLPENFTGVLRKNPPDLVLMIDAAQMGLAPGEIRWISVDDLAGFSASTHGMPLSLLSKFLIQEYNCQIGLIGIQPTPGAVELTIENKLTTAVGRAGQEAIEFLSTLLWEPDQHDTRPQ